MVWIEFIICVVIVIAASNVLSRYADVIAERTVQCPNKRLEKPVAGAPKCIKGGCSDRCKQVIIKA